MDSGSRSATGNHSGYSRSTSVAALPGSWIETIGRALAVYSKTLPLVTYLPVPRMSRTASNEAYRDCTSALGTGPW